MELHPGVFVSNVSTDEWEPDPEVGGEMHVLCSGVGVDAGLSRFTAASGPVRWTPPDRETVLVLEGGGEDRDRGRPDTRAQGWRHILPTRGSGNDLVPHCALQRVLGYRLS